MATSVLRDISEYHIMVPGIALHTTSPATYVVSPVSGNLVKVTAVMTVLSDGDQAVTFEIGGNLVEQNGATATLTILNADVLGDVQVLDLTPNATTFLKAAEDGDAIADGSVIEVLTDAGGSAGAVDFTFTIRP